MLHRNTDAASAEMRDAVLTCICDMIKYGLRTRMRAIQQVHLICARTV